MGWRIQGPGKTKRKALGAKRIITKTMAREMLKKLVKKGSNLLLTNC